MTDPILTLYTVRNRHGACVPRDDAADQEWVYSWVAARIYNRAAPARAMVTRMTRSDPDAGPYSLIALHVTAAEVIPEQCRVASAVKVIDDRQLESERVARAWRIAEAKRTIASARELVQELEGEA